MIRGGAAVLLQNDTVTITVANRVIAIGHQSVIGTWRVKADSRRAEADSNNSTRMREGLAFHGLFYGLRNFCCKTAQSYATPCEPAYLSSALKNTLRKILKNCAKSAR